MCLVLLITHSLCLALFILKTVILSLLLVCVFLVPPHCVHSNRRPDPTVSGAYSPRFFLFFLGGGGLFVPVCLSSGMEVAGRHPILASCYSALEFGGIPQAAIRGSFMPNVCGTPMPAVLVASPLGGQVASQLLFIYPVRRLWLSEAWWLFVSQVHRLPCSFNLKSSLLAALTSSLLDEAHFRSRWSSSQVSARSAVPCPRRHVLSLVQSSGTVLILLVGLVQGDSFGAGGSSSFGCGDCYIGCGYVSCCWGTLVGPLTPGHSQKNPQVPSLALKGSLFLMTAQRATDTPSWPMDFLRG